VAHGVGDPIVRPPACRCVHDYDVGEVELERQRRPPRAGRDHALVAESAFAVDHGNAQVLGEAGVLQPVVHDNHGCGARLLDGAGPGPAIAGDPRRCRAREQQRLIAHILRAVDGAVHPTGPARAAAIPAREKHRRVAASLQALTKVDGEWCLAAPARGQIANADDGEA
jgi:hypothetical protein